MKLVAIAVLVSLLLGSPCAVDARTWYITPDGTGDAPTIQAGINSAVAGDDVLLAPGTYYWINQGAGLPGMLSMKSGVLLHSESGPDVTVIDAQDQAYCISCTGVDADASIEGLTLRRGWDAGVYCSDSYLVVSGNRISETGGVGSWGGAGVHCASSSPTIRANMIENNRQGIRCSEGASPLIVQNTIEGSSYSGILSEDSSPMIEENMITGNSRSGVFLVRSDVTVTSNTISGNSVVGDGGGVYCTVSTALITGNTIRENTASRIGGGVYCVGGSATVSENLIAFNHADVFGGGMGFHYVSAGDIASNTLVGNSSKDGGAICCLSSSPNIWRNIVTDVTEGGALYCDDAMPSIVCNDIWDNVGGDGNCTIYNGDNIRLDPMFCDEAGGNYYLHTDSPCAPDNSPPACGLIGAFPTDCSPPVAVEHTTWGRVKTMYR